MSEIENLTYIYRKKLIKKVMYFKKPFKELIHYINKNTKIW
jgi:hypothetical protein